jgi:hypothetical protein
VDQILAADRRCERAPGDGFRRLSLAERPRGRGGVRADRQLCAAARPAPGAPAGIGLSVPGPSDTQQKAWNVDVYGSYTFYKAFALYGRLGYVQADVAPAVFGAADQ